MTKLSIFLLICMFLVGNAYSSSNFLVKLVEPIKVLLYEIRQPLKVTAMVCWSFDQKFRFTKAFFQTENNGIFRNYQIAFTDLDISKFPNLPDPHQHLLIVDLSCNGTGEFLKKAGDRATNRFMWVILESSTMSFDMKFDLKILNTFKDIAILPISEVFFISIGNSSEYWFKQVYRLSRASDLIIELFGLYQNGTLYDYRSSRITAKRRRDLQGITLRASMVITNNDSLNHLTDYREKHIDTITKVNYLLTQRLIEYVNATVNFTVVSSWGYMNKTTNKWGGMIGELVDDFADIGASALFYTPDRIPYIEYIVMPSPTRSKFVFRSPKLSYTDNVYVLPFNTLVWYCIIALILVSLIFLVIATFVEFKVPLSNINFNDTGILRPSVQDVAFLVFGATCQQGSPVSPKSSTARIIMMLTFTILMFLYTSYSANIVALLQSPSTKIKTLEDLLNSRLKFGADDTVFNKYYFSHATEPIRSRIYEQKIRNNDGSENYMPLEKGVEKIREGLFAFHMELGVGYKVISETFLEDEKCGIQEIQYLQVIDPWYAIQKNSSYKEILKAGMMRLNEHGLQERENSRLYTKKPICSGGSSGKFITASLVDIRAAILILFWGCILAIIILFVECLVHKYTLKWKREVNRILK